MRRADLWLSRKQTFSLIDALKECTISKDLERGKKIHAEATSKGLERDVFLASALLTMYSKCGRISEARKVFDQVKQPDVVLWNCLLLGYVDNEQGELALDLFHRMQSQGCHPTPRTYSTALKACTLAAARETGRQVGGKVVKLVSLKHGSDIHSQLGRRDQSSDLFVASGLVNMYAKCGSLVDARMMFDRMPVHDMVSWTSLLMGYAENGEEEAALEFFYNLPSHAKIQPDATAYVAALKACACLAVKEEGRQVDGKVVKVDALDKGTAIHSQATRAGYGLELFVGSMLVDVYAKCRSMVNAQRVFDKMPCHNLVTWTSLMLGYSEVEEGERALTLFSRMHTLQTCQPDAATFVSALKACTSLSSREEGKEVDGRVVKLDSLEKGRSIHMQARESGCESDLGVAICLVDMYSKCGSLAEARAVFDRMPDHGVEPWTALTLGYAENGEAELALEMFSATQAGMELDSTAFLALLKACTSLGLKEQGEQVDGKLVKLKALDKGMSFHSLALNKGLESSCYVGTSLIDMYAKCGSMVDSRGVFDRMETKSVTSWNALLVGYTDNGEESLALELLGCMHRGEENGRTFVIGLKACGAVVAVESAREIHASIYRCGLEVDQVTTASLVDVYGKCGSMVEAQLVFDTSTSRDLVTWTALVGGYSRVGEWEQVFSRYKEMAEEGLQANAVTLVCLLTACSHGGLVEKGMWYFRELTSKFGIVPCVEHYVCMVDMLSRGNRFDEAVEMVRKMPAQGRGVAWMTVLGGCWKWKNVKVGKVAFDSLVEIDDKQSAAYDLMANIYGSSNMHDEQSCVERLKLGRVDVCVNYFL